MTVRNPIPMKLHEILSPSFSDQLRRIRAGIAERAARHLIIRNTDPSVLWLAAGGISELTPQKLFPLRGRKVILFPDTDPDGEAYRLWYAVARRAERLLGQPLYVSALLEQRATPAQKARKIDIADLVHESECLGAGTGITP